jgi:hypothetical protein
VIHIAAKAVCARQHTAWQSAPDSSRSSGHIRGWARVGRTGKVACHSSNH